MRLRDTALPEVKLVEPTVFRDQRGFFLESYHQRKLADAGLAATFVQDNHSRSAAGVLRGLHAQRTRPQGKLVRVIEGAVWDVAVDIRPDSPTYRRWVGVELSAENFLELWVPPGFAHGFCVLGDDGAQVQYKCTDFYAPGDEVSLLWNDPDLAIDWPIADPVLSAKDAAGITLAALEAQAAATPEGDRDQQRPPARDERR
jgi:dTDP-4-dehydrorhamnose 3,5-epimerase